MPNRARNYQITLFNGPFKGCRKIFSNTDVISAIAIPREFRSEIKTYLKSNVNVVYLAARCILGKAAQVPTNSLFISAN